MRRIEALVWAGLLTAGAAAAAQPISVEGCLRAGSADGEYIVSTGGERHTAMASAGVTLDEHVNHRVQLTGELAQKAIGPVFVVTDVRTLETSCAPAR